MENILKFENNFDKYLWNRYELLHDKLMKKISYLYNVLNNFNDIYHVKKEYYKKLKPLLNEFIQPCYEEVNFENIINIVSSTSQKYNEFEEELFSYIINNIKDLIKKVKKEKEYYIDYQKNLEIYKEKKNKIEKLKNNYHQSAMIAELSTFDIKKIKRIDKKLLINNDYIIKENIDIMEIKAKQALITMSKEINIYTNYLESVNTLRDKLNIKQTNLLKIYEELEKDDKYLYSNIMEFINIYQKKILDYLNDKIYLTEEIQKNVNNEKDIQILVESLKSDEKPEKEIPYIHYPTKVDFDKCLNTSNYEIENEVVKTMKKYSDKIFMDYDEKLEENKNKMRELIYKAFEFNESEEKDRIQLIEYIKDERTHKLFFILLSQFKIKERFHCGKPLIELLSDILVIILDEVQKTNNIYAAKDCIIFSQSFYYNDEFQKNKKIYIIEYIKKHPLFKSIDFWKDLLNLILKKFKDIEEMNTEEKMNISKNVNISEKTKPKIGEVLFSEIQSITGNIKEFGIETKDIIKIIDDINNRYNYMEQ